MIMNMSLKGLRQFLFPSKEAKAKKTPHMHVFVGPTVHVFKRSGWNLVSPFRDREDYPSDPIDFEYAEVPHGDVDGELFARLNAEIRKDTTPERFGDPRVILGRPAVRSFSVGLMMHGSDIVTVTTVVTARELTSKERTRLHECIVGTLSDGWGEGLEQREIVPEYVVRLFDAPDAAVTAEEPVALVA